MLGYMFDISFKLLVFLIADAGMLAVLLWFAWGRMAVRFIRSFRGFVMRANSLRFVDWRTNLVEGAMVWSFIMSLQRRSRRRG